MKKRLAAGQPVLGSWINSASPVVVEIMALAGFDFLVIDAKHRERPAGKVWKKYEPQGFRLRDRERTA